MEHRIKKILVKIENNLSDPPSAQDLARSLNLSASRFRHLFKCEVGVSYAKYVKNLRLQKARDFLETTALSVKEIRARAGIGNESHFISDFKKKFGATPTEYRKNYHK